MKEPARKFTLTTAIQRRRALRFASRFYPLNFGKRMALAAAERTVATAFALAACFVLMLATGCQSDDDHARRLDIAEGAQR